MLNGNLIGQYNAGENLPQSQSIPSRGAKPADYDRLKAEFNSLSSSVMGEAPASPNEPAAPAPETNMTPQPTAEGTPAAKQSKALKGALKGAANAASDDEAVAMLQAILTR